MLVNFTELRLLVVQPCSEAITGNEGYSDQPYIFLLDHRIVKRTSKEKETNTVFGNLSFTGLIRCSLFLPSQYLMCKYGSARVYNSPFPFDMLPNLLRQSLCFRKACLG